MSATPKHTPKPWIKERRGDEIAIRNAHERTVIAVVTLDPLNPDEGKANATLISEAPRLFEAAKFAAEAMHCGCLFDFKTGNIIHIYDCPSVELMAAVRAARGDL